MTTPKIIFIDWNGTLSKSKSWGHLEASEPELFTKIENNLFKKNVDLIKPWMKGELTSEDVVRKISDETGIEHNKVLNEFIKGCELMGYVDTKVPELIKKLKKKNLKSILHQIIWTLLIGGQFLQ